MVVESMIDPLVSLWQNFIIALPGVIAFLVISIVGYAIGWVLGRLVTEVLYRTKLDKWVKTKAKWTVGQAGLSVLLGTIVRWWVFVVFFASAVEVLQMGLISEMLGRLALWLPKAIVAIVILLFGWIAADFVSEKARHEKIKAANLFGDVIKVIIVIFIAVIALEQMGMYIAIAEQTWLIIVGGIMLGVAIAIGIGFGNALKDNAKSMLDSVKKRI